MANKRTRNGKTTVAAASLAAGFSRPSLLTLVCATVFAVVCLIPVVFWGNPYPAVSLRYWGIGTLAVIGVALLPSVWPSVDFAHPVRQVVLWVGRIPSTRFAWGIGFTGAALGLLSSLVVFRNGASTSDELAQLWHARIIQSGRWWLPVDANPEFFSLDTVVDSGAWYSQFPIGGPVLLAIGDLIGAPWLLNPVLLGIAAVAMYRFAQHVYGEPVGRTVAIVFATAPSIVFMAGTMMNHMPTLCLATLVLAALVKWEQHDSPRGALVWTFTIGLLLGLMLCFRPLDAIVMTVVVGVFQSVHMIKTPTRVREWAPQGIGGLVGASPMLWWNAVTTGSPFRFAYELNWGAGHGLGFHTDPYGRAFTPLMGLEHMITYVSELNMFVTTWPVPVMLLAIISLLLIPRATKWDAVLLGWFFVQLLAHGAYWGTGEFLGPRFVFTALPTLVVLVARLPHAVHAGVAPQWRPGVLLFFAACCVVTWGVPQLPLNAWGLARIAQRARGTMRFDVARATTTADIHNALVFLREPFTARLTRRLWGAGLSRSETVTLLATKDACALHEVLQQRELTGSEFVVSDSLRQAAPYTAGRQSMQSTDGVLNLSSPASLTADCKAEFDSDSSGGFVPFGVGLIHEPIAPDGRIDGDIVYVADLGAMANARLRERFANRAWYRLHAIAGPDGQMVPALAPYGDMVATRKRR